MVDRSPYPRMVAALLALVGFFDSLYLAVERAIGGNVICPTGGGCETVAASSYSTLFGSIPVAYLGVAGYLALFGLAILSIYRDDLLGLRLPLILLAISSVGALFSLYLVYLQIGVIGAICFWCMVSAFSQICIWVAAWRNWHDFQAARSENSTAPAPALRL
jgi:uncharacterized membrane protein